VIAAVFTDEGGEHWLHRVGYLVHDPRRVAEVDEATQLCRQVVAFARELFVPAVVLETNGIGRFLPGLLRREIAAAGLRCAVVERTATRQKALRIVDAFDAVLAAGRLHAHGSVRATPFVREMREWQPAGRSGDDGLDAVAACLIDEPVRLSRSTAPVAKAADRGRWRRGLRPFAAATDFIP